MEAIRDYQVPDEDLAQVEEMCRKKAEITAEIKKVIVGQEKVIEEILIALFCRGHCLLVGVPGLAKTLLISTLAGIMELKFNRIQFTPDLMPSDITGTDILEEEAGSKKRSFRFLLFFLVAGALSFTTGTRMIPSLCGVMKQTPLIGVCFGVAALAVTGVPPFNAFFSKVTIFAGGFQAARAMPFLYALVVVAILESVGSFAWILWTFGSVVPGHPPARYPLPRLSRRRWVLSW